MTPFCRKLEGIIFLSILVSFEEDFASIRLPIGGIEMPFLNNWIYLMGSLQFPFTP